MSVTDPLGDPPPDSYVTPIVILSTSPPPDEPPPPYPSQDRRTRTPRSTRRRRTLEQPSENASHTLSIVSGGGTEYEAPVSSAQHSYDADYRDLDATEATPLLNPAVSSPRSVARPPGFITRQRTLSISSTVRSTVSVAPSFAQTVLSAFNPERDPDVDPECAEPLGGSDDDSDGESPLGSPSLRRTGSMDEQQRAFVADLASQRLTRQRGPPWRTRWLRYFRPITKRAYYSSLFHLLVLNFPYALIAWVYLFVFTVAGTTTLMALPLGAVLCFCDLIGARALSRGELALQTKFHGPLAYPIPGPPLPIFVRHRAPNAHELEAGLGTVEERSFYRNTYAMFTDPTSYQALFYFIVIKPGITIVLSLLLIVLVPLSIVFVWPAPAVLRLARRLGIWQANIAVEGLCLAVRYLIRELASTIASRSACISTDMFFAFKHVPCSALDWDAHQGSESTSLERELKRLVCRAVPYRGGLTSLQRQALLGRSQRIVRPSTATHRLLVTACTCLENEVPERDIAVTTWKAYKYYRALELEDVRVISRNCNIRADRHTEEDVAVDIAHAPSCISDE
ncbi:predicted protein [Postia placenta Mad-698-R]|uniref:Uncharacterized protein n=1 Tax=Postia placenta MAD-698-R-SB12 TaxID=670580 RepID=A0A1X6NBD6_9APHY|nr:hypothetical protein POSPLADRAFT_1133558 [Postia placenta MAD-698-R-SB12]EED79908.1 predicted protein [Postia placenta Mad-698-R]OSX65822.1 hypothetical protein POSPLADRAFT_1133558 [Postia placenta MAD-698-R-SB12]